MTDIWELLKKMDCEECSIHDECDNKNLCAEWITKAQPELLKLKEKAEKWDKYVGTGTLQDLIELKDKLEAIKTWYDYIYNDSNVPTDDFRFPENSMVLLKKILEVEPTSGGTAK